MTSEFSHQSWDHLADRVAKISQEHGAFKVRIENVEAKQDDINGLLKEVTINVRAQNDYLVEGKGMRKMFMLVAAVASSVATLVLTIVGIILTSGPW